VTLSDPHQGLPEPHLFRDITVLPPVEMYRDQLLPDGGPVWPGDDNDPGIRFLRQNKVIDRAPAPSDLVPEPVSEPCLWGGATNLAFGHMVAECMTRVLWSVRQRPQDRLLLVLPPGRTERYSPPHLWAILDWWGVSRDRVRIVTKPLRVATLRVMPQAEQLFGHQPSPAYLDLLDSNLARSGLAPVPSRVLYVTRAGMIAQQMGAHLGERYLVDRLIAAGVPVLDPATAPLPDQLAAYAGAETIVFAEGSALHGRQLLGRIAQDIVVLTRRQDSRIARAALTPRVRRLTYVDAVRRNVSLYRADGAWLDQRQVAFTDLDAVLSTFEGLGIDLRPGWSTNVYDKAVADDLALWLTGLQTISHRIDHAASRTRLAADLQAEGMDHLLDGPGGWIGPVPKG
jgi:hypothetical protein